MLRIKLLNNTGFRFEGRLNIVATAGISSIAIGNMVMKLPR